MALRAAVLVPFGVVGDLVATVEIRPVLEVGQGHVGADASILDGDDVLGGPVLGVPGHVAWPVLPPKVDPPQQVTHRLALHDIGRGDERSDDDAALAAVDDVMVVVDETNRAPVRHGGGIRVGRTDSKVIRASLAAVGGAVRIEPALFQESPWRIVLCTSFLGLLEPSPHALKPKNGEGDSECGRYRNRFQNSSALPRE